MADLTAWLSSFHYSGMTARLSGKLDYLSSFTGKEYSVLAQVMPFALLHIKADPLTIKGWCLVSEVTAFSFRLSYRVI